MAAYTTIDDPSAYFKVQLYTGNGSANHAITFDDTDTDMQPDLVWIKNRSAADQWCLFDAVRGATEALHFEGTSADAADAEDTDADTLDSFASDGFQVDADDKVNTSSENYVSFCWKESATSGFDIVSFTGNATARTVSHSLSAVPHLMFLKNRADATRWWMYHHKNTDAPETDYLEIDHHGATTDNATAWNDTAPTSSVFSVGTSSETNGNTDAMIAWLWSEKQGFSKFGSFAGSANADGPFIFCGFSPKLVILRENGGNNGQMFDTERSPGNEAIYRMQISENTAENTSGNWIDILSNGFKVRTAANAINSSGTSIYYIAFAEAPLVNSNGVPCNAR